MFEWNPWALPSFAGATLAAVMAAFVYLSRPWRAQNRLLALAIGLSGLSAGLYFGLRGVLVDASAAWLATAAGICVLIVSPLPYLLFLATLETPLSRPLRRRDVRAGLILVVTGLELIWLTNPRMLLAGVEPFRFIEGWMVVPGPLLFPVALLPLFLAEVYGFFVALSAYRHARTPIGRQEAKAYAIAFGTRDLLGAAFIVVFGMLRLYTTPLGEGVFSVGVAVVDALFVVLLAYAILQYQLFNIHLTIKWTFRQGIVGSAFAGAFFLGSELVEEIVAVDGTLAGIAVAGAVSLAFRPLQRFAGRVANAAFPHVSRSPEYVASRTEEVYRAALEGGYEDGRITVRERGMLDRLRERLGLTPEQAERLEAEVGSMLAPPPEGSGSAPAPRSAG